MRLKSTLCVSAFLLSASSLSAAVGACRPINSFEQGHELRQSQLAAAYNAPARIDVRGSWDIYFTGGYIFWQPSEENLELGISNSSATVGLPIDGNVVDMNFKYKSGFKAALGIFSDLDNWDALIEYTWLTGRHSSHSNGPTSGGIIPFWGHPANVASAIASGKSRWRLNLDFLDLNLGRSCYVGTRLIFRPFFGARGAWIDQKYTVTYTPSDDTDNVPYQIRNTTTSWGVGPEIGLTTSWLLGYGVRLIGKAEGDLLFTRYNLRIKEQKSTPSSTLAVNLRQKHIYYLRPHLDMELGLGWGTYLSNHNYHLDLSATYDFQVLWNQNMFRTFVDSTSVGKSLAPDGDLFLQGLTANLRFDF